MSLHLRRFPVAIAVLALGGGIGGVGLAGTLATAAGADVGCGVDDQPVVLDLWGDGRLAPLVGDPNWGATIRTLALPAPVAPGRYRVFGVSEDNLSAGGQLHEQWA